MKSFNHTIRNFFGFTRAQTNGFVVMLILMPVIIFSEPVYRMWISSQPEDFSAEENKLDSLIANWEVGKKDANKLPAEDRAAITFFEFDPNTVSLEELKALGFSEKLASRMINYRNKGGKFRIKTDMRKLYGMDSAFYSALFPFIKLPNKMVVERKDFSRDATPFSEKAKTYNLYNLNEADTTQLQRINGIGPVLAKRIIKFRDRLGGFITSAQLTEVYGLDSTVIRRITLVSFLPENPVVNKINLNTCDEKILTAHPYFSRKIAAAIVAYRFQHGSFKSVNDLGKINLIDKKTLEKIYPYVTVDP